MSSPRLTVITPAYNAGAFLQETIDSVLEQDYRDFDYIVIDDGSTDDTPQLLERYRGRLTAFRHENCGEQRTVNRAIELAKTDIVGIVNADDPIRPGLLSAVAAAFEARPELVAVYPDWVMIDRKGGVLRHVLAIEYDYLGMIEGHFCIPGPGTFFRLSMLRGEPARSPKLRYSGDFDLWLRLVLRGPMQRLPGFLATWRYHPGGASASNSVALAEDKITLVESFFARTDLPDSIRRLERQALSAAYYRASLHMFYNPQVPGRRLVLRSYLAKPFWPRRKAPHLRRSLLRCIFIVGMPVTDWLARICAPGLIHRRRHLDAADGSD
jgi:glycosyltransferase involved in cell wall biosynthesis